MGYKSGKLGRESFLFAYAKQFERQVSYRMKFVERSAPINILIYCVRHNNLRIYFLVFIELLSDYIC